MTVRNRYLILCLVMLLGLYPITELTRVISIDGAYYFPEMKTQMLAEMIIMWVLYLSIIPVFLWFSRNKDRQTDKSSQPGPAEKRARSR